MGNYGRRWGQYIRARGRATSTDTADHELIAAPGSGRIICISKVSISNSSATVTPEVHLKSGTTIIWTFTAPFLGGNEPHFPDPISCAANEALNFACGTNTSSITVSVAGFTTKDGEY